MDKSDVIDSVLENMISNSLMKLMGEGMRLGKVEDLTEEDLGMLMNGYCNKALSMIKTDVGNSLAKIPAFHRLCKHKTCEGVLDCKSDHK